MLNLKKTYAIISSAKTSNLIICANLHSFFVERELKWLLEFSFSADLIPQMGKKCRRCRRENAANGREQRSAGDKCILLRGKQMSKNEGLTSLMWIFSPFSHYVLKFQTKTKVFLHFTENSTIEHLNVYHRRPGVMQKLSGIKASVLQYLVSGRRLRSRRSTHKARSWDLPLQGRVAMTAYKENPAEETQQKRP